MAPDNVVFRFDGDSSSLKAAVDDAIAQLGRLAQGFKNLGQAGQSGQVSLFGKQFKAEANDSIKLLQQVEARLAKLREIQAQGLSPRARTQLPAIPEAGLERVTSKSLRDQAILEKEIAQTQAAAGRLGQAIDERRVRATEKAAAAERQIAELRSKYAAVRGERGLETALRDRLRAIDQLQSNFAKQRALLREQVVEALPERRGRIIESGDKERLRELQLTKQIRAVQEEIDILNRKAAAERNTYGKVTLKTEKQITEEVRKRTALEGERAAAQRRQITPDASLAKGADLSGLGGLISDTDKAIESLASMRRLAQDDPNIAPLVQEYQKVDQEIGQIFRNLQLLPGESRRHAEESQKLANAYDRQRQIIDDIATRGLPQTLDLEQLRAQSIAQMPKIEQTLIGAFDGMARRFQATLQFAISGALIFGVQQFLRRFVETAIEVERAFADIESALEFDIEFDRGTVKFDKAVNDIRVETLLLAREFNVLPTEANKAAFVMVSRFGDVDNALKATRAQLLATKISTIDQSETLRALTAIAEGFAAAVVEGNETLSLQERLYKREAVAADLYGKALDYAVIIQQKFGIEVEDTLEGTARANEAFRQLGFTMEETGAIVAAVSRQLGQTGVNVAERLVRSIGQINAPNIRDELLELAAASEALVLSPQDFATGKSAWEAIVAQIERIQKLEPQTAQQILQIIGQRREIEAVAAALGSTDLQKAILNSADEAAGAAEQRYTYLAATISETIKSIATEFEGLAQNLTELGILGPLSVALKTLDFFLTKLNDFINAIDKGFQFLNFEIGGVNIALGDLLKTLLAIEVTFLGGARAISAFQSVSGLVTAGKAAASKLVVAAEVVAAGSAGAAAGAGGLPKGIPVATALAGKEIIRFKDFLTAAREKGRGFLTALVFYNKALLAGAIALASHTAAVIRDTVGITVGRIAARIPGLKGLSQLPGDAVVAALGKTTLGLAGAAAGAALAIYGMAKAAQAAAEFERDLTNAKKQNLIEARKTATEQNLTPAQTSRLQSELDLASTITEIEEFEARGSIARIGGAITRAFQFAAQNFGTTIGKPYGEDLIDPGVIDQKLKDAYKLYISNSLAVLGQNVADAAKLGGQTGPGSAIFVLRNNINRIQSQMEDASPEELEDLKLELAKAEADWEAFATQAGITLDAVEATIKGLRDRLAEIADQIEFGQITPKAAVEEIRKLRDAALAQADIFEGTTLPDRAEQASAYRQLAADATRQLITAIEDSLDFGQLDLISGDQERAARSLELYRDEFKLLSKELEFGAPKLREILRAATQAARDLARAQTDFNLAQIQSRVDTSRTTNQQLQAQAQRINQLFVEFGRQMQAGNVAYAQDLYYDALRSQEELAKAQVEANKRIAIARARLSGPILNDLNRIKGEMTAAQKEIEFYGSTSVEGLEAMVRLAELQAEKAQLVADTAAAFRIANVSVRDSLGRLKVELENAAAELKLTGDLFGENTAQFADAKTAVEEAKAAIADALLELDDLNRILALEDPSSSYERAVLNRRSVEERLSPDADLGPLDRARLEVELIDAKLAEEQAFYQDRLGILAFQYESEAISKGQYVDYLTRLRDQTDTTTQQGRELWMQINGLIEGLTDDMSSMAFNIPDSIRLPTLFEVRRAVEADQLGVNYVDSRQQNINIFVSEVADAGDIAAAISNAMGDAAYKEANRYAPGAAGITATPRVFY